MERSPNRLATKVVGALLLIIGILGITSTAGHPARPSAVLDLFAANLPQAVLHVVLGAAIAAAGLASVRIARFAAQLGGTLLLALGIAGLFLVDSSANVLALGASDNLLHFCAAVVLLTVGFGAPERRPA